MGHIEKQRCFLEFLISSNKKTQSKVFLKYIDREQYTCLKRIAQDILKEIIPLTVSEYIALSKEKYFIRKLAEGKVSRSSLPRKYDLLFKLVKIAMKHHESHKQVSTGTLRRVGKNKRSKQQRSKASSDDESTTSEKSESSSVESRESYQSSTPNISDDETEECSEAFRKRQDDTERIE